MEVVSFEIAKKLKEKGFDEVCYNYYEPLKHCLNQIKTPWTNKEGESYGVITAPTISQVLKWLREEKEIFIRVSLSYDYSTDADGEQVDRWTFWLFEVFSVGSGSLIYTEGISEYDSYELAALAGMEDVIDNLI